MLTHEALVRRVTVGNAEKSERKRCIIMVVEQLEVVKQDKVIYCFSCHTFLNS